MASIFWDYYPSIKIPKVSLEIKGYSRAARHTSFVIKGYDILLDCGMPSDYDPKYIFLTHCHADHCQAVPNMLLESRVKKTIFCPKGMVSSLNKLIDSFFTLTKGTPNHNAASRYDIVPVDTCMAQDPKDLAMYSDTSLSSGIIGTIDVGNKKWIVRCIRCTHTVTSIAYGFSEIRKKLKSHVIEMDMDVRGKYISDMKKEGREDEIFEQQIVPILLFMGDTDHRVLENCRQTISEYPAIIIESTFLFPEDKKKAKKDRHMHWDNLKPFIINYPDHMFILTHFSMKYSHTEIEKFFKSEDLPNVFPIIPQMTSESLPIRKSIGSESVGSRSRSITPMSAVKSCSIDSDIETSFDIFRTCD